MANKKTKITQRQALNIIIFAMAFMIVIFIFAGKIIERKLTEQSATAVATPFLSFNFLELNQWQLRFVDSQWQQQPAALSSIQLQQLAQHWQQYTPLTTTIDGPSSLVLSFTIGAEQLTQWQLRLNQTGTSKVYYLLSPTLNAALPIAAQDVAKMFPQVLLSEQQWQLVTAKDKR
ncbi:MAG: hypothetical protein V2I33_10820 [Kangiellaceae bacterium]|jgi:hypothetical protein|nr:hypothetical protein [Kangiellaceae bacterium]